MNHIRRGNGKPLLLIHGIGGSWRSWQTILDDLSAEREVIVVDLPGHGDTPPLHREATIPNLADALRAFIDENDLRGIDAVGSSMGARLVLEMARRGGILGAVVSLDPGGFWRGWQRHAFFASIFASIRLVRLLQPWMPRITQSRTGRHLLLAQFSANPERLSPEAMLDEMRDYAASPVFDELLKNLAYGEEQQGAPAGSIAKPLVIGWGRHDRVCFPGQAKLAIEKFPDARLHWFERCGHFPHWDVPSQTVRLILDATGTKEFAGAAQA